MNSYNFLAVLALVIAANAVPLTVPASTQILTAPAQIIAPHLLPAVARVAPVIPSVPVAPAAVATAKLVVPAGSGLEGQYVPDLTEKLYDDGSYKPELIAQPLSASPVGLVPSGSGLEGKYVPDLTEKLYDDGSYKGELVPVPFAASPYGLVPAGSGLEGQYVNDLTEKLYDDGSYKPGLY